MSKTIVRLDNNKQQHMKRMRELVAIVNALTIQQTKEKARRKQA